MENHGALGSKLAPIVVIDLDEVEMNLSACGKVDESHDVQHRGFSRSVWTCNGEDFSSSHFETHVVKGCYVSKSFGYIVKFDERSHGLLF